MHHFSYLANLSVRRGKMEEPSNFWFFFPTFPFPVLFSRFFSVSQISQFFCCQGGLDLLIATLLCICTQCFYPEIKCLNSCLSLVFTIVSSICLVIIVKGTAYQIKFERIFCTLSQHYQHFFEQNARIVKHIV